MTRRLPLLALAAVLGVLGLGALAFYLAERPTVLRVAVGPAQGEDARLIAAFGRLLARDRADVRLVSVPVADAMAAATALDADRADLAVVRTDVAMPENGQTLAIMRRNFVVIVAPAEAGLTALSDLRGRRVGVLRGLGPNTRLLDRALAHLEVPAGEVGRVPLASGAEAVAALRERRVDALLAVGTSVGPAVNEAVGAVLEASIGPPVFLPVAEADAIALRNPQVEAVEVVRGAFGGSPPRPADAFRTLAVTYRLVAAKGLDEDAVGEVARLLFQLRPALAANAPLANGIEAPDTDKGAALPVHPGAAAYYDGEQSTFFERYGDWMYLGAMSLGLVGSVWASVAGRAQARGRQRAMGSLAALAAAGEAARGANAPADLAALAREVDGLVARVMAQAARGDLDERALAAFGIALSEARRAIAGRRAELAAPAGFAFTAGREDEAAREEDEAGDESPRARWSPPPRPLRHGSPAPRPAPEPAPSPIRAAE